MSTEPTRPDIPAGLPEPAREAAYRAYRCWRIGDDGDGRLHAALVAAEPLIRAAERERLGVIPLSEALTGEQVAEFRERFEAAMANPGPLRVLPSDGWRERAEAAEAAEARLAELENAITWDTSCLSCSRILDSAYAETVRREAAEARLAVITAWARRGDVVDSTAILAVVAAETPAALAALGTGEEARDG